MFNPDAKFLVVDDFKTMRSIVKKTLMGMGYTKIEEAEDGAQALELVKQAKASGAPFACIVSDWNMPNMSGLQLLTNVRSMDDGKNLPFILVTAENEQKQVMEAVKSGVSNYVVKPFTMTGFKEKLEAAYKKHFAAKAA